MRVREFWRKYARRAPHETFLHIVSTQSLRGQEGEQTHGRRDDVHMHWRSPHLTPLFPLSYQSPRAACPVTPCCAGWRSLLAGSEAKKKLWQETAVEEQTSWKGGRTWTKRRLERERGREGAPRESTRSLAPSGESPFKFTPTH